MNEIQEELLREINDINIRFKELNYKYSENLGDLCRAIIQRDIEKWKNENEDNAKYFKEILIDKFTFKVKIQKNNSWHAFGIDIDNYEMYSDCFIVDNELQSISSDHFLKEKYYSLTTDLIEKLIDEFKNRILKLEKDLLFVEEHKEINIYGYRYNLYNGICAPEVFYSSFDDIIKYLKKFN